MLLQILLQLKFMPKLIFSNIDLLTSIALNQKIKFHGHSSKVYGKEDELSEW